MSFKQKITDHFPPISIILVSAFIVRLTIVLLFSPPLLSDEIEYRALGQSLADGNGFSLNGIPTASRAPAYPAILASLFVFFGNSYTAVRIFQAFADTVTCALIFAISRNTFSVTVANWASLIYALFPGNALYVSVFMTESVFTTLFMTSILMATFPNVHRSAILKLAFGAILALLVLLKPSASILILSFFCWEWYRSRSIRTAFRRYFVVVIGFVLIVSPWMIRNKVQFDHFSLTSNGGVNFWIGHNETATGSYRYYEENNPLEKINGEFERSAFAFGEGLRFMYEHPLREVQLIVLKFVHLFEPDFALMQSLFYRPEWRTYSRALFIYREFPPLVSVSLHILTAVILIAGIWGLIFTNGSLNHTLLLFTILIVGWIGIHLVIFSVARFRIPIMPLFMIAAAFSVSAWRSKQYTVSRIRILAFSTLSVLLIGSWIALYSLIYLI